ncbi:MAG: glycosyltransferase family 4 protein [Planctomycetota bacterium]
MTAKLRFVHVFATFGRGGPQVRATQLMRHLGPDVEHVVQAMDGDDGARALLDPGLQVSFAEAPRQRGFLAARRAQAAWLQSQQPDLVLTYNWGAIEAVAAAKRVGLPLVHHEDGFGPEEIGRRLRRRSWLRRWLLRGVPLIVPSLGLRQIAAREWAADAAHLVNGVDLERFSPSGGEPEALRIGSVGGLRPEKDYATLLQALARMDQRASLRLVGGGALEAALRAEQARLKLEGCVEFVGFTDDTARHYREFTVFAMSSRTEQMPIALVEAMACGLPVVATDVGDTRAVLAESNRDLVVPSGDPARLAAALDRLCADPALRRRLGADNRAVAAARFEATECLERFADVYRRALR